MANPDRLSGLDASFLSLENAGAHMHVGSVLVFDGQAPPYDEFVAMIESRLHQVPRYRQKLAFPPLAQARPVWVDDPHFNAGYHVRHTALPAPAGEAELRRLAGRVFSQRLDRSKPLWEIWLVDRIDDDRFALVCKTHHALVDGISGVDIVTVLFDLSPEPSEPAEPERRWLPAPTPSRTQLLSEALLERATVPTEIARSVRAIFRAPRQIAEGLRDSLVGVGAMAWAGMNPAPPSPYNCSIGPHRRFTWVRTELGDVKAIKNSLGGTVNDVVLATVSGALGRHLHRRGETLSGRELKAMVPVSVRAEEDRGALGNQVAAMMAPLPVWCEDPARRLEIVNESMAGLKDSGQAVGAQVLTQLSGFAPPTIMTQASRLMARQRMFNVVVTNVPGPQMPLYLMGHELRELFPMVPLARNQALGVAIMSYNGKMNFGLVGDYDAMHDLDDLADDFQASLAELADVAGVAVTSERAPRTKSRTGATA
jgi:diacylglycerol O-acyltransferase